MELWKPSLDNYGNRHEQGLVQPKNSWRTLNHRCLQRGAVSQPERLGLSGKVRPFHIHASLPHKLIYSSCLNNHFGGCAKLDIDGSLANPLSLVT